MRILRVRSSNRSMVWWSLSWSIIGYLVPISTASAQTFREISSEIGILGSCRDQNRMAGGIVCFDYNQDNYPDIFVIGGENPNSLYRNNWDGTFFDISRESGTALESRNTMGAVAGDFDNDGDDDLFVTTSREHANVLLRNNGNGTFTDISQRSGIVERAWSTSASLGDFNLDGLVDIYVNNYAEFTDYPFETHITQCSPNFLYQNLGNNQFQEVAAEYGVADMGCGLAVAFTDFDNDRDPDLYVANDFGYRFSPNELYVNTYPEVGFKKSPDYSPIKAKINAMGVAVGDYDEDEDFDYYLTNIGNNLLFENIDEGFFFQETGVWKGIHNPDGTSWGTAFLDFNNDSYLDLLVANGKILETNHQNNENRLFKGTDQLVFEEVSATVDLANPAHCRGLSVADLDQDGDLDFLFGVVNTQEPAEQRPLVYINTESTSGNWLKVKLKGTSNHRNAYGSRIELVIGDRKLIRESDGGSSYLSHHFNEVHFGLGKHTQVDSLIVFWPGGDQQVLTEVGINQGIILVENHQSYGYRNEVRSIFAGDSLYLAGAFRTAAGVYPHRMLKANGQDSLLIITKLQVLDRPPSTVEEIQFKAYPNPFTTDLQIRYALPEDSQVRLIVFNLTGSTQRVLIDQPQLAGEHRVDLDLKHDGVENGLYIFSLSVDGRPYALKVFKLATSHD